MILDSANQPKKYREKAHYHQVHCLQIGKQKRRYNEKLEFRFGGISVWLKITKDETGDVIMAFSNGCCSCYKMHCTKAMGETGSTYKVCTNS